MDFVLFAQTNNFILKPLAWLFSFVIRLIYNGVYQLLDPHYSGIMGITIILFTLIFRVLLFPLSLKQQRSTRKMQRLQPKIQRIQDKYKNKTDPESTRQMQMEINDIYKENKTSPLSGCLPLLIQMPILFVLYEILRNTAFYIYDYGKLFDPLVEVVNKIPDAANLLVDNFSSVTKTIEKFDINSANGVKDLLAHFTKANWNSLYELAPTIRSTVLADGGTFAELVDKTQELNSFLGFNLTDQPGWSFPGILWPIFAGVTTWLQSFLMTKASDKRTIAAGGDPKSQENATMKSMNLIMPFFMAFIMISVPLGIGLYWIIGNILQLIQQYILDKIVDEEEYKEALARKADLEERRRLKELAKSNIDKKTGKRIGTAAQSAAMRSAMAGNRKAANGLRARSEEDDTEKEVEEARQKLEKAAEETRQMLDPDEEKAETPSAELQNTAEEPSSKEE